MAAPSISTYILSSSSHYYGSEGGAAVMTSPSDSVTKVSAIISQTSGGAAIETVDTTVKTSSDLYADRWALTWPTAGIASSPYYVRMWATNSDGDGAVREVAPYIYFPPSVSVTSPADGSTLTDSSVTMAWSASDDYGISYQRVSVSHDGTELWGAEVEGNSIAVPSSVVFEDGESYSFSVTARNGKGMESTATNTASFSFVAPSVPALVIAEGDGKSASITVTDSSYTESGTVLEASSAMMESLTIHGLSVQDGTPTPSAPVAIKSVQGRNLASVSSLAFDAGNTTICDLGQDMTFDSIIVAFDADNLAYTTSGGAVIDFRTDGGAHSYVSANNLLSYFVVDSTINGKVFYRKVSATFRYIDLYARSDAYAKFASGTFENIQVIAGNTLTPYVEYGAIGVCTYGTNLIQARDLSKSSSAAYYFELNVNSDTRLPPFGLEEGVTYTFSADVVSSVEPFNISVGAGNGSYMTDIATKTNLTNGRVSISFTPTASNFTYGNILALRAPRYSSSTTFSCTVSNIQLEVGSPATAYEPYSSTTTPIPVTLRSLPDGTHDEWISGETVDTLVQRVGETMQAVTDGVTGTVGVDVLSSTGEIANGAQVLYKLATPITTTLAHVTLPYVDGSAWVDAEVTPNIEATFRPVDFPDQPAADSVDVVRVNADGSTWTVASNLTTGDTVTDPLPPLGVDAVYKAVGKTSAGGISEKLYMHEIPTTGWVLNFGDAAQETVGFIYNPQATMTLAQGGESYHFADGGMGGGFPVFYPTTDSDASGTLAFDTVLYGDSDRLLDLCRRYPVAWLRDPFGHRWRAHVRPSVSHGVGQVWPVTIAWDAVRFEEV